MRLETGIVKQKITLMLLAALLSAPYVAHAAEPTPEPVAEDPAAAFNRCTKMLKSQGAVFTRQEPLSGENGCHIADPVKISSLVRAGQRIDLAANPTLSCRFASRLSAWLSDVAAPITQYFENSPLKAVSSGPGYVCRNRYNKKNGKISEHALGNAIDINGFVFAGGKRVAVGKALTGTDAQRRMLMALRLTSCGYFTTVLGPGANAAHKDHFHLDFGKHGRTWNYRICE